MMPGMDGYEVCRAIRANPATGILPVVMVTALDPVQERIKGIEAGADDFLTKPINQPELLARVKSLLRINDLYRTVQAQAAELASLNAGLEARVQQQVVQLERLSGSSASSPRSSPSSSSPAAPRTRSRPIGATSPPCSSTCAASRRSPNRRSRRK